MEGRARGMGGVWESAPAPPFSLVVYKGIAGRLRAAGGGKGAGSRRPRARRPAQGGHGPLGPSKPPSPAMAGARAQLPVGACAGPHPRVPDWERGSSPLPAPRPHLPAPVVRFCAGTPARAVQSLFIASAGAGSASSRRPHPAQAPAWPCAPQFASEGHPTRRNCGLQAPVQKKTCGQD